MERMVNSVEIPKFNWHYCYRCGCINILVIDVNAINVFPLARSACSKVASIIAQSERQGKKAIADKGIWPGPVGHGWDC